MENEARNRLFREAVALIDAGDVVRLQELLLQQPSLARERLVSPGDWLRTLVGDALEGYFKEPYLLWLVADNPIWTERMANNIAAVARVIIDALKREEAADLQAQLDYTLGLTVTGRVPRQCGVQIALMDVLIDAGATPGGGQGALAHGNMEAARHLIERGGALTLAVAVCLEMNEEIERLASTSDAREKQIALTAAALNGLPDALALLIRLGVDINAYSSGIHTHATPLHHAVWSGSLDAVRLLVDAGAKLDTRDKVYNGTPLDWAAHEGQTEIGAYLKARSA